MPSLSRTSQTSEPRFSSLETKNNDFLIDFLEPLVDGNLPEGCSVVLFGPPGVGKTIFCDNIVSGCLKDGLTCLYITLDKSPDDVRRNLGRLGIDTASEERKKTLVFVDGFNWLTGESLEGYRVEDLGNLTGLSIQIASAAGILTGPVSLVLDSVSPLLVYNPENAVVKFLQILLARIKSWNSVGFFVVQDGVHSSSFCNTLSYLVDGVFEMKIEEQDGEIFRYFRVRSLKSRAHRTRWMPFSIQTNRSFKLKPKEKKKS